MQVSTDVLRSGHILPSCSHDTNNRLFDKPEKNAAVADLSSNPHLRRQLRPGETYRKINLVVILAWNKIKGPIANALYNMMKME